MRDAHPQIPRVCVVIPTYNRRPLLQRALASVEAQTEPSWQAVVVDDGSTDDTAEWFEANLASPRYRLVRSANSGAAAARNAGAAFCEAPVITFLDSDDEAEPTWLERILEPFARSKVDIVCCGFKEFNAHGVRTREVLPYARGPIYRQVTGLFDKAGVYATRTALFRSVGGFAPALPAGQHNELALRLLNRLQVDPQVVAIPEALIRVHVHGGPRIRTDPRARRDGARYMLEHHTDVLMREPSRCADSWGIVGVDSFRLGNAVEGRRALRNAARVDPASPRRLLRALVAHIGLGTLVWRGTENRKPARGSVALADREDAQG